MATVELDKENPSLIFGGGAKVFKANQQSTELAILNSHSKQNLLCTPKVKFNKQPGVHTITKTARKALGDVINTTTRKSLALGVTPKANKIIQNTQSIQNSAIKVLYNKEDSKIVEEQQLPPVESFIGAKFDNFDDLFSEGKLSTIFSKRNLSFYPQLPNGENNSSNLKSEMNVTFNFEDKKGKNQIKRLNKTLAKKCVKCPAKVEDLLQDQPNEDNFVPPPQLEISF